MKKTELISRIDYLLSLGKEALSTRTPSYMSDDKVNSGKQIGFRTASLSVIRNLYGENHPFYRDFNERVGGIAAYETENGINIINVIKNEVEKDWLVSFKQLVSAEIFSDFLEMSKYLLDNKYKDPAAVMIGSTLEEHLRLLCKNNLIDTSYYKRNRHFTKKSKYIK